MRVEGDNFLLSASDLSAYLGCQHRTQLDRRAAAGLLEAPPPDPMLAVMRVRGLAHEQAYIEHLQRERPLHRVDLKDQPLDQDGMEATRQAMAAGTEVITQAPLVAGRFLGIADVLLRVNIPSPKLGQWSYVVVDTKLAVETRAGTVLQLCLYTRIVGEIQGLLPDEFWVVSPRSLDSPEQFRTTDYLAFARRIERELKQAVDGALPTDSMIPEPVNECEICRWWSRCDRRRRDADHLSFVAGISRLQRRELDRVGISTLTDLAGATLPLHPSPQRGSSESYERVHHQARVQHESIGKSPVVEFLPDPNSTQQLGLARLPEPSPGDVFLDLEGDPFIEDGGREYLFGYVTIGEDGQPAYTARWGLDTLAEKAAFEELIDTLLAQWEKHPGFAVYHFGAYEPAALKRLMGRHATKAEELDRLLRGQRFVDLHTVVRESLRIGIETYGLKQLEAVHGYERDLDLRDASLHKHRFERALELGVPEDAPEGAQAAVELYNRDDCISTLRLRNWLETKRAEQIAAGTDLPRPTLGEGDPSGDQLERSAETQALMDALLDGVPDEREAQTAEQQASWTLAHLLEWHRREGKAGWWEYYRLVDCSPADLLEERHAISGMQFVARIPDKRIPVDRYSFSEQDHDLRPGQSVDYAKHQTLGTIREVDLGRRTIDVKKTSKTLEIHPEAVFLQDVVKPHHLPGAIQRVAEFVIEHGLNAPGKYRAARDLLLAAPPRLSPAIAGALASESEETLESATRLAVSLDHGVLPVQGPPGTGKTHTGARVVCALVARGQKVGITGPTHKVIRKLLDAIAEAAAASGQALSILQKPAQKSAEPNPAIRETTKAGELASALANGECHIAAGTVWEWSRPGSEGCIDTLVIDEAGQLSLANAIAASTAARNVLLLGDPQQLEQPIQGSHPEGCDTSVLEHLLGDHDTVPPDRGLFLDTTWRLHPEIRTFTSELFYEGRLNHHEHCERQALVGPTRFIGAGLWLELVEHEGNTSSSAEEVQHITLLVEHLIKPEIGRIDFRGKQHPLTHDDLRIVSPYNAQVAALKAAIPDAAEHIGTVDRFQGQEAPVVIYSMTTSSTEEAPRGLEFLFSLNRLNVATSRARCTCILVVSSALLNADCKAPRQMKLVNALCRYQEMARQA